MKWDRFSRKTTILILLINSEQNFKNTKKTKKTHDVDNLKLKLKHLEYEVESILKLAIEKYPNNLKLKLMYLEYEVESMLKLAVEKYPDNTKKIFNIIEYYTTSRWFQNQDQELNKDEIIIMATCLKNTFEDPYKYGFKVSIDSESDVILHFDWSL